MSARFCQFPLHVDHRYFYKTGGLLKLIYRRFYTGIPNIYLNSSLQCVVGDLIEKTIRAKVFLVQHTKVLKGGTVRNEERNLEKEYKYGAIRVQDKELTGLVGKIVEVTVKEVKPRRR